MALNGLWYTIGAILVGTAVFALIVALTARKIDFGDRLFKIRDREIPLVGSVSKRRSKRRGKAARTSPSPRPVFDSIPKEEERLMADKISVDAISGGQ